MAKQSSKKSKPKREAHGKTLKKRGRKVAPVISRSALPTAKTEYVSENDDPTRPKSDYTPPIEDDLVNVE
ncbi:hypothetical protein KY284_013903 [Solanum tuberosum]|nr:hypothetical protein KY284_013903 [Solanum tuberosum]